MKKIILPGLAVLLLFSSFPEKKEVKITLDIQNFDPQLLNIFETVGEPIWPDHQKKVDGKIVITYPIDKPTMRSFRYGPTLKRLFLHPGQSLSISIDPNDKTGALRYGGSLATENQIMDSIVSRMEKADHKYMNAQETGIAIGYIDSFQTVNGQFFEKLAKGKKTSVVFNDFVKASILYYSACLKIRVLERQKGLKDPARYGFLKTLAIEKDQYIDIPFYQWFLYEYLMMETAKRVEKLDGTEKLVPDAQLDESLKVISGMTNPAVRDYLLAAVTESRLLDNGIKGFDKYYDYFKQHNSHPVYAASMKIAYERKLLLAPGKPAPQFTLSDVDGKKVSLKDFRGKYVLIDFWQTLCPRSARELPHYLKLYADYKDEDIIFLSISVNEDENVWKSFVKESRKAGVSLRAENSFYSKVYQDYQVPGLPFFIIVDREGNILGQAAAKPSSKEIRGTLDQLLKGEVIVQ